MKLEIGLNVMTEKGRVERDISYVCDRICMSNIIDIIRYFAPRDCDIYAFTSLFDLTNYRLNDLIIEIVNNEIIVKDIMTYGGKIYDE